MWISVSADYIWSSGRFFLSRGVFEWNRKWKFEIRKKILRKRKKFHLMNHFDNWKEFFLLPTWSTRRSRKRYGKIVVCERESIKKKYCEKKTIFNVAFHVSQILLATENYFWIQESFFVFTFEWKQSETSRRTAVYETDGKIIYSQKKSSDKRLLIFFACFFSSSLHSRKFLAVCYIYVYYIRWLNYEENVQTLNYSFMT